MAYIDLTNIGSMAELSRAQAISYINTIRENPLFTVRYSDQAKFNENQRAALLKLFSNFVQEQILSEGDTIDLSLLRADKDVPYGFEYSFSSSRPTDELIPLDNPTEWRTSIYLDVANEDVLGSGLNSSQLLAPGLDKLSNLTGYKPVSMVDYYPPFNSFRAHISTPDNALMERYPQNMLQTGINVLLEYLSEA